MFFKMNIGVFVLFSFLFTFVTSYTHNKPVALTLWPSTCVKGQRLLNDCNWCRCGSDNNFVCSARACNEVDLFGHFNDAIQDIKVGMEGKGSWRTGATACEPGVQYDRKDLICVCGEDGNWPNPVCRDAFRFLYQVDISQYNKSSPYQKCQPSKLYLIGCNVCFCSESGRLDPIFCTKRNCSNDDPVMFPHSKKVKRINENKKTTEGLEVYAECDVHHSYRFGCRTCMCLRNNRLICDDCPTEGVPRASPKDGTESFCDIFKTGEIFSVDCNLCFCDKNGYIYCTSKQCLMNDKSLDLPPIKKNDLEVVNAPYNDVDCAPGTKYVKDCNTCYCSQTKKGVKYYSCTKKPCYKAGKLDKIKSDCVSQTRYETNCQICSCSEWENKKLETCQVNTQCLSLTDSRSRDANQLRGYCEPLHNYQKDCNTCRCLADGKTLMCTPRHCNKKQTESPVIVDIYPITQKSNGTKCPKDHMYQVECNICFCLSSGNVLCSAADCAKQNK